MQERTPLVFLCLALALPAQSPRAHSRLEGEVLSATSMGVANADVTVVHDGVVVARARSDGNGAFVFPKVPAEFVVVRAESDEPAVAGQLVDCSGEGCGFVRLFMAPARGLTGTVRDDGGQPVAGAWVAAASPISLVALHCAARTDRDGRYRLTHVPMGRSYVRAWADHHDAAGFAAEVKDRENGTLDCELKRELADWITIQLEEATDEQLRRAEPRVLAYRHGAQIPLPPELTRPRPESPGRWVLRGWTPDDDLWIAVALDGATMWPAIHCVKAGIGTTTRHFVVGDPDSVIRGLLVDAVDAPVAGIAVMAQPLRGSCALNAQRPTAVTDAEGRFAVQAPVGADVEFALRTLSSTTALVGNDPNPVWFTGTHYRDQVWEIPTRPADGLGLRFFSADGAPAGGTLATIWSVDEQGQRVAAIGYGTSGLDGRLRCSGLRLSPPLDVEVQAAGPGGQGTDARRIRAGGDVDLGAFTLLPGASVFGTVIDQNGETVPGTWILFSAHGQQNWGMFADRQGQFERSGLPPGTYRLLAYGDRSNPVQGVQVALEQGERTEVELQVMR